MGEGFESVEKTESEDGQEKGSVGGMVRMESVAGSANSAGEEGTCGGTVGNEKVKWSDGETDGAYCYGW